MRICRDQHEFNGSSTAKVQFPFSISVYSFVLSIVSNHYGKSVWSFVNTWKHSNVASATWISNSCVASIDETPKYSLHAYMHKTELSNWFCPSVSS